MHCVGGRGKRYLAALGAADAVANLAVESVSDEAVVRALVAAPPLLRLSVQLVLDDGLHRLRVHRVVGDVVVLHDDGVAAVLVQLLFQALEDVVLRVSTLVRHHQELVGVVLVSVAEITRDVLDGLSELLRVLRFHRVGVMNARQLCEFTHHFVLVVRLTLLSISKLGKPYDGILIRLQKGIHKFGSV